ncbi:hypothetical protein SCLARK_001538 [Spiroplasma clarkii]|nr:hypothetical protein SCLARK_001538 [Spiroplasma clarkii]
MAAKNGSSDPEANLALRSAIDKAKSKQVPTEVIQRAIKKAEGGDAESYSANRYEGYGPGNSMLIVDSLTNNVNRAIAEIRDAFNKNGGKIGQTGAVSHSFQAVSIFAFTGKTVEEILELLMEADVEVSDVVDDEDGVEVIAPFQSFNGVKTALDQAGIKEYKIAQTTMLADSLITIQDLEAKKQFEKLIDRLNELEDVQDVYHNVELEA